MTTNNPFQASNTPSNPGERLVGHAERMAAGNSLTEALGGGYIDLAEYDRRLAIANNAKTHSDIHEVLRGLEAVTTAHSQEQDNPYTIDDIDKLIVKVNLRNRFVLWSNIIAALLLITAIFVWPHTPEGEMSDPAGAVMVLSMVWLLGFGFLITRAISRVSRKDIRFVRALGRLNPLLRAQQLEKLRRGGREAAESEYWVREFGRRGKWLGPNAEQSENAR